MAAAHANEVRMCVQAVVVAQGAVEMDAGVLDGPTDTAEQCEAMKAGIRRLQHSITLANTAQAALEGVLREGPGQAPVSLMEILRVMREATARQAVRVGTVLAAMGEDLEVWI